MFVRLPYIWAAALFFASAANSGAQPDEGRVRDELREIFAQPEFNPGSNKSEVNLRWLITFVDTIRSLRDVAPIVFWMIVFGCIALLVFLLARLAVTVRRAVFINRGGSAEEHAQRLLISNRFRLEADQFAESGDLTAAVRSLFLSLVFAFDENGRFSFQRSLTNREYLREFVNHPALGTSLNTFVDILDDNWYGERPTSDEKYRECRVLYDRLIQ